MSSDEIVIRRFERKDFDDVRKLYRTAMCVPQRNHNGNKSHQANPGRATDADICHPSVRRYINAQLGGSLASTSAIDQRFTSSDSSLGGAFWVAVQKSSTKNVVGCVAVVEIVQRYEPQSYKQSGIWWCLSDACLESNTPFPSPEAVRQCSCGEGMCFIEKKVAELKHLCVAREWRRYGIAKRLCDHVKDFAISRKCDRIVLETLGQMEGAIELYTSLGYQKTKHRTMGKGVKLFELLQFEHFLEDNPTDDKLVSSPSSQDHKADVVPEKINTATRPGHSNPVSEALPREPSWETGTIIKISHFCSGLTSQMIIENVKDGTAGGVAIKLAPLDRPYDRLFVSQAGKMGFSSKRGRFSSFAPSKREAPANSKISHGMFVSFMSLGNPQKTNRVGGDHWYIGYDSSMMTIKPDNLVNSLTTTNSSWIHNAGFDEAASIFHVEEVSSSYSCSASASARNPIQSEIKTAPHYKEAAALTFTSAYDEIVDHFVQQGYCCVSRTVQEETISEAVRRINRGLGIPQNIIPGGVQPGLGKLDGGVPTSRELLALFNDRQLRDLLDVIIGPGMYEHPTACQIALRFPDCTIRAELHGNEWHTDGMRQGKKHPFTLLVGVALSSMKSEYQGNLAVFPESHKLLHEISLENGRLKDVDEHQEYSCITASTNPWGEGAGLPDLGTPRQLMMEPGDVVIAHSKLAHRGCPNMGHNIRYMVYFRIKRKNHGSVEIQRALDVDPFADMRLLGKYSHGPHDGAIIHFTPRFLTLEQIKTFISDGVLVVPNVMSDEELISAQSGISETLLEYGIESSALDSSAEKLNHLSSTGGAGGVLDLFYPNWKLLATLENKRYYHIMTDLYQATYAAQSQNILWAHPYGEFNGDSAIAHVDRIGFRIPDKIGKRGPRKRDSLQRSLTPHLDCCPMNLHGGGGKEFPRWRPIQCLLALSDTLKKDQGGFECVPGFHREFEKYYSQNWSASSDCESKVPACKGDFCPIRTKEDRSIIQRFKHIPITAGSAVFWDQRLPHANSKQNLSQRPRMVVYGGFLPDVEVNRKYAVEQLRRMRAGLPQPDFWMEQCSHENPPTAFLNNCSDHAASLLGSKVPKHKA